MSNNEYEVYRTTTLGIALQETLDEMIGSNQMKHEMGMRVFKEFDRAINSALSNKIKNKITFKSKLDTYRNCDNVWTLLFDGFEINSSDQSFTQIKIPGGTKVKIVACEGKSKESKGSKAVINDE